MTQEQEENNAKAVQDALKGLDVKYENHDGNDLTPNMAKVNDCSIIWHSWAYCSEGSVEVMTPDGEVHGHVPISELRLMVGEE